MFITLWSVRNIRIFLFVLYTTPMSQTATATVSWTKFILDTSLPRRAFYEMAKTNWLVHNVCTTRIGAILWLGHVFETLFPSALVMTAVIIIRI